ncbi:MAG: DUF1850 domain-containing protein [Xanthobacteraceae bacterium]|jgi:hypothetical protein
MIDGLCIAFIGVASAVVLPTDTITLSWTHTVEGTPWEEDYVILRGALVVKQARVKRSGAGMEAPDGAVWAQGWWHYVPSLGPLPELVLANSSFAPGYRVCWHSECRPLNTIIAAGNFVKLVPAKCNSNRQPASD